MTIIIAVVMGMLLTAPISSAAIAIAINLDGIAGGAAVVGTTVQMIGFAVQSRKDNNIGMVLSIAFGTSMLQFKNILKKTDNMVTNDHNICHIVSDYRFIIIN